MKYSVNKLLTTLLVLIMLASFGCKSKKTTVDSNLAKDWNFNNALDEVLDSELHYTTLSAKGNFELRTRGSGKKVNAVYKILKDSVIQISVRVPILGEVASASLTPDSIVVIDRMKGRYVSENYTDSEFMKSIDFNYYNLQAILTNKLFVPGKQKVMIEDYARFKLSKVTDVLMLQTMGEPDVIYNFAVDATEKIVSVLIAKQNLNSTLQFTYSDFIEDSGQIYPTLIEGALVTGEYDFGFAINYPSLEIDKKNLKIDINIPRKYNKVTFSEFLKPYLKKE